MGNGRATRNGKSCFGSTAAGRKYIGAAVSRARDGIAYLWVEVLGHPGRPLAPALGVRPQAVY
jgi:hypothetical protein